MADIAPNGLNYPWATPPETGVPIEVAPGRFVVPSAAADEAGPRQYLRAWTKATAGRLSTLDLPQRSARRSGRR